MTQLERLKNSIEYNKKAIEVSRENTSKVRKLLAELADCVKWNNTNLDKDY